MKHPFQAFNRYKMNYKKKNFLLIILGFSLSFASAQHEIKPAEGYSPQIAIMVDMLEDIKDRIAEDVRQLNQAETDYLFDDKANSIGSIIMHLAATEAYYQVETLEERQFSQAEDFWGLPTGLGPEAKGQYKGKPIAHYLELWDQIRDKTLEGLKKRDDEWLAANIEQGINYHWVWFHVLEHQASHMGQIALIKNRLP